MTKRTYQVVRDAIDKATGTLSCNWCFRPKPAEEIEMKDRANGRPGKICAECRAKIKARRQG